jgi:hypothetical protein
VRPSFAGPVTAWEGAQAGAEDSGTAGGGGGGGVLRSQRRLVLTARALLERRTDSYEARLLCMTSNNPVLTWLACRGCTHQPTGTLLPGWHDAA